MLNSFLFQPLSQFEINLSLPYILLLNLNFFYFISHFLEFFFNIYSFTWIFIAIYVYFMNFFLLDISGPFSTSFCNSLFEYILYDSLNALDSSRMDKLNIRYEYKTLNKFVSFLKFWYIDISSGIRRFFVKKNLAVSVFEEMYKSYKLFDIRLQPKRSISYDIFNYFIHENYKHKVFLNADERFYPLRVRGVEITFGGHYGNFFYCLLITNGISGTKTTNNLKLFSISDRFYMDNLYKFFPDTIKTIQYLKSASILNFFIPKVVTDFFNLNLNNRGFFSLIISLINDILNFKFFVLLHTFYLFLLYVLILFFFKFYVLFFFDLYFFTNLEISVFLSDFSRYELYNNNFNLIFLDLGITKMHTTIFFILSIFFIFFILNLKNIFFFRPNVNFIVFSLIDSFLNNTIIQQLGIKRGQEFSIILKTFFFFILLSNIFGLIPFSFTITSHLVLTFGLSFSILSAITIFGFYKQGFKFLNLLIPGGAPKALLPILIPIELLSYIVRCFSLAIRLFANMMSGHSLLYILAGFVIQIASAGFFLLSFTPFIIVLLIVILEIGVAFLQAYVFLVLTCIYLRDGYKAGH